MKKMAVACLLSLVWIFGAGSAAFCAGLDIEEVVDDFAKATDLQRKAMTQDILGKNISAGGIVSNAGEYDFFDTVNDIRGTYYQVSCDQQKTKNSTPYQLNFLFKDKETAQDLDRGEQVRKDGRVVRIDDERLQISVWIFCGDMTDKDAALFKKDRDTNN